MNIKKNCEYWELEEKNECYMFKEFNCSNCNNYKSKDTVFVVGYSGCGRTPMSAAIKNTLTYNSSDYMEELRDEYKGLDLTDDQIINAKSNNISPEQVKLISEICNNSPIDFAQAWESVLFIMREYEKEEIRTVPALEQLIKTEELFKIEGNKKVKKIKPWEKKMFFN